MLYTLNFWARSIGNVAIIVSVLLLQCGYGDGKSNVCEFNLNCCKHHPWSAAFQECCREGCCPDCNQVSYVSVMQSYKIKEGCEASHECCVYTIFSNEWLNCCSKYPCCTLCHMVSKGCCYNDKIYEWGHAVEVIYNRDTDKLICGAKLHSTKPYFVAAIVPALYSLVTDKYCDNCNDGNYCIEDNGILRVDGSEWWRTRCLKCSCVKGAIHCSQVLSILCPGPPYPECVPIPPEYDECCNRWDCTLLEYTCFDAYGTLRQEGEEWTGRDDPCLLYVCKPGGMVVSVYRQCPPPDATPPPGCRLYTRPGACCKVLYCPECKDENGTTYEAGDSWVDPKDPCYTYQCLSGGIIQRNKKECPVSYRSHQGQCVLQHEDCCSKWICGGCNDRSGEVHALGTTWIDDGDPCVTFHCTDTGIRTSRKECPPLEDRPAYDCYKLKKTCCYEWKCRSIGGAQTYCTDDQGARREVGESWIDPEDPCLYFSCTEDLNLVKAFVDCAKPPEEIGPYCSIKMDQCCPVFSCPCVDNTGAERVIGDIWEHPTNKCLSMECKLNTVEEKLLRCPTIPAKPSHQCVLQSDGCCDAWNCQEPCPDPDSFNLNCFHYFDQCYSDDQCGGARKCCLVAGCGHQCMMVSRRGQCPVIRHIVAPHCTPDMKDGCQWDHQCPGEQKCCMLHCTKHCVDPL